MRSLLLHLLVLLVNVVVATRSGKVEDCEAAVTEAGMCPEFLEVANHLYTDKKSAKVAVFVGKDIQAKGHILDLLIAAKEKQHEHCEPVG